MADMFDVLEADHVQVKSLLSTLGATADPETQAQLAERLVIEESKHEAAEEQYFWPTVRRLHPDGDRLADEAISQEDVGKKILDEIDRAEVGSAAFDELVETFRLAARRHIAFEENEVWPKVLPLLDARQLEELGAQIEAAKEDGPTRPHPRASSGSRAQKTAGAVMAATDRARDRLSGRGH